VDVEIIADLGSAFSRRPHFMTKGEFAKPMSSSAGAPIFEAVGLTKAFGGAIAVNDISFRVEAGEILGIAGPNGSGKSTLFNIITNVPVRADSGRTLFQGIEIQRWPGHKICAGGLARTFQRESVFPALSAIDNVLVAIDVVARSAPLAEREDMAEAALDLVGFPATLHNMISGAPDSARNSSSGAPLTRRLQDRLRSRPGRRSPRPARRWR
jgi:ABC-type glutathione transport system ATPase component